jgi:hypothetical protein
MRDNYANTKVKYVLVYPEAGDNNYSIIMKMYDFVIDVYLFGSTVMNIPE